MLNKIQNFFLDLQTKDEATKKWWLVILSSAAMLIIIPLWISYLNLTIQNLNPKKGNPGEPGFFATMKNGAAIASEETGLKFSELMASLQEIVNQTNSITIEGTDLKTNTIDK